MEERKDGQQWEAEMGADAGGCMFTSLKITLEGSYVGASCMRLLEVIMNLLVTIIN